MLVWVCPTFTKFLGQVLVNDTPENSNPIDAKTQQLVRVSILARTDFLRLQLLVNDDSKEGRHMDKNKRKELYRNVSCEMTRTQYDVLNEVAKRKRTSKSELIRDALAFYLQRF